MPCRDYEDDNNHWDGVQIQAQNDKLARIACNALTAFQEADPIAIAEFLENNEEADTWWTAHQKADAEEKARKEKEKAEKELKKQALAKLTAAERKALGV
jgi:hypothetical protein